MRIVTLIIAGLSLAAGLRAETGREVLEAMNARLSELPSYRVKVRGTQTLHGPRERHTVRSEAELAGRGERRYSELVTIDPEGKRTREVRVFDGKTYWDYNEEMKSVRKIEVVALSEQAREKLAAEMDPANLGFFGDLEYALEEIREDGRSYRVLKTTGPSDLMGQKLEDVEIRIDGLTGLPARLTMRMEVEVRGGEGKSISFRQESMQDFYDWEPGAEVPAGQFVFQSPEGTQVIDGTAMTDVMLRQTIAAEEKAEDE